MHSPQLVLPKLWMLSLTFVLCALMQVALGSPAYGSMQLWNLHLTPSLVPTFSCSPLHRLQSPYSFSGLHVSGWWLSINAFCFSFPYSNSSLSFPTLKTSLQTISTGHWTLPHLEGVQQHKCFASAYHGFSSLWLLPLILPLNVPSGLYASGCGRCVSHPPWSLSLMSCGGRPSGHALLDDLVVSWM